MPTIMLHIIGKVQGVFYRASTRDQALALGLTGWVRNLPDGSVEVQASGPAHLLDQLEAWCKKGPANAKVSQVTRTLLPDTAFVGFQVLR